jgi:hypothetical protein
MPHIFISYRRDDTQGEAGRLYDHLVQVFGNDSVFMDVTGIELGCDFRQAIDVQISSCDIVLVLIGKEWRSSRLDDPKDFVRIETGTALMRGIPVIPVLFKGARMPSEEELPSELKELHYRNAIEITHARWRTDILALNEAISRQFGLLPNGNNKAGIINISSRRIFKAGYSLKVISGLAIVFSSWFLLWPAAQTHTHSFRLDPGDPKPKQVKGLTVFVNDVVKITPNAGLKGDELWNCKGNIGDEGSFVGFAGDGKYSKDRTLRSENAPFCSLIYRIGQESETKADAEGELFLTVNDTLPYHCNIPKQRNKAYCYTDNMLTENAVNEYLTITVTSNGPRILRYLRITGNP